MNQSFKLGDPVIWRGQSGGYTKVKAGVVVAVIKPGEMPSRDDFLSLYRTSGISSSRLQTSYVVHVPTKTGKGAGTIYWPRPNALKFHVKEGVK